MYFTDKEMKQLQVRTLKVLEKLEINNSKELQRHLVYNSIYSLLKVKNFGRKSLNDLVSFCINNKIEYYY